MTISKHLPEHFVNVFETKKSIGFIKKEKVYCEKCDEWVFIEIPNFEGMQ